MSDATVPAQPMPKGREDKIRLIMREFNLARKPAFRLLRDNANDINRTLKSRRNIEDDPGSAPTTTEPHRRPEPQSDKPSDPVDTSNASNSTAPPPPYTKTASPTHDTELTALISQLSIIGPLLSTFQRRLAAMPKGPPSKPDLKAAKKMSFYAYSIAHLPRSLSVLPPHPLKPGRVAKRERDAPSANPMRYPELYEGSKKYPYNIFQQFLASKTAMDVHVMGCNSKEDAEACLKGYEQSLDGRVMFVQGGKRVWSGTMELVDEWGFVVWVDGRKVCKVVVLTNEKVEVEAEM